MISDLSIKLDDLFRMSVKAVKRYCSENNLLLIRVNVVDPDVLPERAFAVFNIPNVCIFLSSNSHLSLIKLTPIQRVWWLNYYIVHEVVHYEQYLELKKKYKYVTKSMFNEHEAEEKGAAYANWAITTYNEQIINPIKLIKEIFKNKSKSLSISRNPNHVKDYKQFHGMKNAKVTSIEYEPPKQPLVNLGELVSLEYRPNFKSRSKGTVFSHIMGDDGKKLFKTNVILATDGKNFFIIRKSKKVKRPFFNSQGIIG